MTVFNFLAENLVALITATIVISLLIGSFLNVVIYRLPLSMMAGWKQECEEFLASEDAKNINPSDGKFNIAFPASHCTQCKTPIKAWQNIPIVSYLLLRGKCHTCKVSISPRYPIVEFVTALLSGWAMFYFGMSLEGMFAVVLTWALITLTMIDYDHQLLPDSITLPLLWLGLIVNTQSLFVDIKSAVIGAAMGYLILWSVYWAFKLITKKEGMGFGDFKLLAALGAWMGWQQLPVIIILSAFTGAVIGIVGIVVFSKEKSKPIPFGPYLAIAGWIALFWGDNIQRAYLSSL